MFTWENGDVDLFLEVHLVKRGFWRRLRSGIRYIFGYKCKFGAFDSLTFSPKKAEQIKSLLQEYLDEVAKSRRGVQ